MTSPNGKDTQPADDDSGTVIETPDTIREVGEPTPEQGPEPTPEG